MECNICYEKSYNIVDCFSRCKFKLCRPCFRKLLEMDDDEIYYTCPMCRGVNMYNQSKRFTKFVDRGLDLLKIIIHLYKNDLIQNRTNQQWTEYTQQIIDNNRAPHIIFS